MTLVSDEGEEKSWSAAAPKGGLLLERSLAVILFSGASIFGLAAAVSVVAPAGQGVRVVSHPWALTLTAGLIALICGWLAMLLWSGRSIPRWFIIGIILVPCAAFVIESLIRGDLESAAYGLGMFLFMAWQFREMYAMPKKQATPEL